MHSRPKITFFHAPKGKWVPAQPSWNPIMITILIDIASEHEKLIRWHLGSERRRPLWYRRSRPSQSISKVEKTGKVFIGKWGNGRKWQPTVFLKRQKPTVKFQEVEVVGQNRGSSSHLGQHQNNQAIGWGLCYGNFCFRDNARWIFLSSHNHNWETLRDNSLNNRNLVLCDVDEWELGRN